ncbi:hypothetical protein BCR42DRAFT_428982 [Absidia repens]|uniref:Reverse transcriptase zinc-binding domain-containing protein n=1 Tax=Absidia repens TaxID=90262 RepID=A0A1X2HXL6_9FUNG|nr:hypothetical protein BCR42DRAFT_428982 [Absidia repens]
MVSTLSIKIFGKCPMYPQARSIFLQTLTKRIHHNRLLNCFGSFSSPTCSYRHRYNNGRFHFLVGCPSKWHLWQIILHHFYPTLSFALGGVLASLQDLTIPPSIINSTQYLAIDFTILRQIWNHEYHNPIPIS